jgi:hypothetical protein
VVFFEFSRYSAGLSTSFLTQFEVNGGARFDFTKTSGNEEQWLFGSLTCSSDVLPIDQMWPHQLHQSASRNFNHRVLYFASKGSNEERKQHYKQVEKLQSQNLIDQVVNVEDVNAYGLATRLMEEKTARAFVDLDFAADYNKAMLAFLTKCIDVGYDHCAWLDPDIFVHRGKLPWVDEAVLMSEKKPGLVYSRPRAGPAGGFSSRYFVYHREALQHLLPLTSAAFPLDTFEALFQENMLRKIGDEDAEEFAGNERGDSWVIHPPDAKSDVHSILEMCANEDRALHTLISIVEEGNEDGEDAFTWRGTGDNDENMDLSGWQAHVAHRCNSHDFWRQLFAK